MSTEAKRPASEPVSIVPAPSVAVSERHETAAAALAARARADIEARTIVALNRPRAIDAFRQNLLASCDRSGFAEIARYSKPLGGNKFADGFTIRFAEECVRFYRNLDISSMVVSEDDERRVIRCAVTDLESNVPWSTEVVIPKTVERRKVSDGDEVIRKRQNSEGVSVYIRRATEDEIAISQNRLCAKANRNLILNHIPSDILEEAEARIITTLKAEQDQDPTAARKKVVDAFFKLGVAAEQLIEFLGHEMATTTNAELEVLRKIWAAMKEDSTIAWSDVMEDKRGGKKGKTSETTTSAVGANAKLGEVFNATKKNEASARQRRLIENEHTPGALTDEDREELRQLREDHPEWFTRTAE